MTKLKIYKLNFKTPLHISNERDDYGTSLSVYHSDSMYAALTAVLAITGNEIPANGDLGFTISSLFPYYQKGDGSEAVYFLPKLNIPAIPHYSLQDDAKKIKKAEWFDISYFNKHINGDRIFTKGFDCTKIYGKYLSDQVIDDEFISSGISQRVAVSRDMEEDARPFYMERLTFKGDSGMYFIAEGETELLEKALNILQYEGIGTDRTVGNGFFEYESDYIELDFPRSNVLSNLSLFLPESKEEMLGMLNTEVSAYEFQKRGGWITDAGFTTLRKNSVHMFSEGSVFKNDEEVDKNIQKGIFVDLRPRYETLQRPVFRCGKAIFIPVKTE